MTKALKLRFAATGLATFALVAVALLATSHGQSGAPLREWVDSTGKFRIKASLVSRSSIEVKLKKADGSIISVPLKVLSDADKKYLRDLPTPGKSTTKPAAPKVSQADREKADQQLEQALALLKLDAEANAKLIDRKLREASKLDPESIRAEFIRGLLHLLVETDLRNAERCFAECKKRAPKNPAALNNLAIVQVKAGRYAPAVDSFVEAMELAPGLAPLSHNLGRLLKLSGEEHVRLPSRIADRCADVYAEAVTSKNFPKSESTVGWLLLDPSQGERQPKAERPKGLEKITGGGTGFVVKRGYVVTNRHVVGKSKTVKLLPAGGSAARDIVEGTVVAVSSTADLAVVRCDQLRLPPVNIVQQIPRRGSDIMVLGFPQFSQLGTTLKSTRGAVTSLPTPATENMILVDAEMNSGNSGGPVANKYGQVVAVATAVFKPVGGTGGKYGAGIPIARELAFLKQYVPGLNASPLESTALEWPDVDDRVSRSTVLVLTEGSADDSASNSQAGDYAVFLDPTCPVCNGTKKFGRRPCQHCRALGIDPEVIANLRRQN